jgi:hypothetical protein
MVQATDRTLNEAKFINSSLHFLEMVIVALQERSRGKKSFVRNPTPFSTHIQLNECMVFTQITGPLPQQLNDERAERQSGRQLPHQHDRHHQP